MDHKNNEGIPIQGTDTQGNVVNLLIETRPECDEHLRPGLSIRLESHVFSNSISFAEMQESIRTTRVADKVLFHNDHGKKRFEIKCSKGAFDIISVFVKVDDIRHLLPKDIPL